MVSTSRVREAGQFEVWKVDDIDDGETSDIIPTIKFQEAEFFAVRPGGETDPAAQVEIEVNGYVSTADGGPLVLGGTYAEDTSHTHHRRCTIAAGASGTITVGYLRSLPSAITVTVNEDGVATLVGYDIYILLKKVSVGSKGA